MIVCGAVGALIRAAHLANVQHVQLERLDDRFVEPLGSVVVVDADGQVPGHVRHWIPPLECEMDASEVAVQPVKVEDDLVIEELGTTQIPHSPRQDVLVQYLCQRQ